jgi:iron complex transport system substrate-binding protein
MLFAIGAGDMVVGVTHECDYPVEATQLPRLTANALDLEGTSPLEIDRHIKRAVHAGSSIYGLDKQLLHELCPDVIVTQELCQVCAVSYGQVKRAVRTLSGNIPIMSLEPENLDGILDTAIALGEATGHQENAALLVASLRHRIDVVESARAEHTASPARVVCIEWTDPLMAGGHWVPEMVRCAGGTDPLGVEGQPSHSVEWSTVLEADPEVMVLMPCGFDLERTCALAGGVTGHPAFGQTRCAHSGRLAAVDGSAYFNRPGPRIVDGLEILAAILRTDPGGALPTGARWIPSGVASPL